MQGLACLLVFELYLHASVDQPIAGVSVERRVGGWVDDSMDEWMNDSMNGWMNDSMNGRMNERVDE